MLSLSDLYKPSGSEKVQDLDVDLKKDLDELKAAIEENEMLHQIHTKPISSVHIPKDVEYFKQERKLVVSRLLQVSEAQPLKMQADLMREEMNNSESPEYTSKSLPLLLHQYFLERIQQLVQCKYLHMLRWKRFCEHTSTIESLYPLYTKRVTRIVAEYNDCIERAQRLSNAREAYLAGNDTGVSYVKQEDLLIYLRFLVCHLYSLRLPNQYLKVLQWLPVLHKSDTAPPSKEKDDFEEASSASKIASRYQDDNMGIFQRPKTTVSRPSSAASGHASSPIPQAPPINAGLLTTTPLPSSAFTFAAAAAGGGLATSESTLGLPLNVIDYDSLRPHLSFLLNIYGINYDLDGIQNSADEMELYAAVNRKFRLLFNRQEHMRNFKAYDRLEIGNENWGSDSSIHSLKQESNWLPFVQLKPERDPLQEKKWTELRQYNNVDEILKIKYSFLSMSDAKRVQDTLRDHAAVVRDPEPVLPAYVTANKTPSGYNTAATWRKIYTNPDRFIDEDGDDMELKEMDDREIENVDLTRSASARKRKDSYDYMNTVRMLANDKGMDDGKEDTDPALVQGAYLSFLHLRHLRLRDLHRTVLSVLNYFRSLERTLTINDVGLSQDSAHFKRTSSQNHRTSTEHDGTVGGGGGIGNHGYIHNTPAEYKLAESEFMEYADVENHDDFYTVDEGRVHVQDQRGYFIVYDAAEQDIKKLEKDLLLVATKYIEKDRDLRQQSRISRSSESGKRRQHHVEMGPGDFDIPSYAHQEVDRFGVLLDIWSNEAAYQECKRELIDCYIEAYQHMFDRDEKRALAQVITNLIFRRPRFDFDTDYFIKTYRTECVILRQTITLVKGILDRQIETQREYVQKVCRDGDSAFGLPLSVVPKQPISVNLSRPALKNVFMLEFHSSLCIASKIPVALKYALQELIHVHRPETVYDALLIEKKMLEVSIQEWTKMIKLGKSYSDQTEKDLFSEVFADDPLFMCEIAQTAIAQKQEDDAARKSQKQRQISMIDSVGRLIETLTHRHRLIDSAWETEILAKIYKRQAEEMGYHESHMYIRFVQFEYASYKEDAGKPPPTFMTQEQDEEASADRYVPLNIFLAIHELDEGHVGRFSFRSRDGIMRVLRPGGLESFSVVLKAQIVQKNALMSAVQLVDACTPTKEPETIKSGRLSPTETKSEKSSLTQLTGFSSGTGGTALGSKRLGSSAMRNRPLPESFVSMKLEKTPSRDLMLNEFVDKSKHRGSILRNNPEEMEKLKRELISKFCFMFNRRMTQFSLRSQIIAYYNSMLRLLEDFPTLRSTYFMMGEANEKKEDVSDLRGLESDPRQRKPRPRQLLTNDGKHVLNLWFIPHHIESLTMFKKLDDEQCVRALSYTLMIVSSLHDILHYLCAHSRLGSSHARLGSRRMEFVSADWGGTEGIGSELREIQKQIDNLPDPTDPTAIVDFMNLRRDVMFLEFDTAVRHCMADTFLSTGNVQAFKSIRQNIHHALPSLSNIQRPTLYGSHLTVPEPLEPMDLAAREIFPWRAFLGRNGPFPLMFWQFHLIEYYIQLCLAGLKEVDRHVANGEILGVTLLMEDVLQTGYEDTTVLIEDSEVETARSDKKDPGSKPTSRAASRLDIHRGSPTGSAAKLVTGKSLSRTQEPVEAHRLLKFFLLQWKCLEFIKYDWGKRRLQVEEITKPSLFKEFCKLYKSEMLLPVLQSVARRLGQGEMYEGIALDTDPLVMPRGASEIEVRTKQLVKLLETYECHMIMEIRRKLSRELTLVMTERAREENALATDLWKRPVMKESFTLNKPHMAEEFFDKLMSVQTEDEDAGEITFPREHVNKCVMELAINIMAREKSNFENYTMYYENLLRANHQILYQKEQECTQFKQQLRDAQNNVAVEVQCDLANQAHDMLMEITALRAKIYEMRNNSLMQESEIREKVKKEYNDLIGNMMECTNNISTKFDEFRHELHDDVNDMITETRREAISSMEAVKQKTMADADEELIQRNLAKSEQIRELKNENHNLNVLIMKMKAMNNWKQNHSNLGFVKTINKLKTDADHSKKEYVQIKMNADEKVILLRQQLAAIRKALTSTEKECTEIRKQLDKELKEKLEKSHEAMQRAQSQKQLELAKQANIEKLVDELDDRETRLKLILTEKEKAEKNQMIKEGKIRKDMGSIRKHLHHERGLKLGAFNRVDELQAQVYDMETAFINRTPSVIPQSPSPSKAKLRAQSAHTSQARSRAQSSQGGTPTSSGLWPPPVMWPGGRSLTPGPPHGDYLNNLDKKTIQRPKTVHSRLRSRIAEQLMNELELDSQNTIVQLEELQLDSGRPKELLY